MAVGDAHVFPGFLTPVLTQLFFPKPPTTFLTCFCRGERWKYAGKKSCLNRGSNSQPPGHESDTLTTEPPRRGLLRVSYCDRSMLGVRPSVCPSVNNYLKNLLLWNQPTDFNETSQKWSLRGALSEYLKDLNSVKNSGCHGNRKKKI